jgi:hypothetical protein
MLTFSAFCYWSRLFQPSPTEAAFLSILPLKQPFNFLSLKQTYWSTLFKYSSELKQIISAFCAEADFLAFCNWSSFLKHFATKADCFSILPLNQTFSAACHALTETVSASWHWCWLFLPLQLRLCLSGNCSGWVTLFWWVKLFLVDKYIRIFMFKGKARRVHQLPRLTFFF